MYTLGRDITAWMITYMAMALMTAEVQVLVSPVIVDGREFFPHSNSNHPPSFNAYIYILCNHHYQDGYGNQSQTFIELQQRLQTL